MDGQMENVTGGFSDKEGNNTDESYRLNLHVVIVGSLEVESRDGEHNRILG